MAFTTSNVALPITDAEREASRNFRQPVLRRGQPVVFWPHGHRAGVPYPGIAMKENFQEGGEVINRTSHIVLATGQIVSTCPHVDDPELAWSYSKRKSGAWDYSDYESHLMEGVNDAIMSLQSRIAQIELQMNTLTKPTETKATKSAKKDG